MSLVGVSFHLTARPRASRKYTNNLIRELGLADHANTIHIAFIPSIRRDLSSSWRKTASANKCTGTVHCWRLNGMKPQFATDIAVPAGSDRQPVRRNQAPIRGSRPWLRGAVPGGRLRADRVEKGRRNRLPHQLRPGGAGGFACQPGFFMKFRGPKALSHRPRKTMVCPTKQPRRYQFGSRPFHSGSLPFDRHDAASGRTSAGTPTWQAGGPLYGGGASRLAKGIFGVSLSSAGTSR
jgi:hypothetical protein